MRILAAQLPSRYDRLVNKHPNHSARHQPPSPEAEEKFSRSEPPRPIDPSGSDRELRPDTPNPSPMRWHEPPPGSITPPPHNIPRRKRTV